VVVVVELAGRKTAKKMVRMNRSVRRGRPSFREPVILLAHLLACQRHLAVRLPQLLLLALQQPTLGMPLKPFHEP
jgi:hypothetical protein